MLFKQDDAAREENKYMGNRILLQDNNKIVDMNTIEIVETDRWNSFSSLDKGAQNASRGGRMRSLPYVKNTNRQKIELI